MQRRLPYLTTLVTVTVLAGSCGMGRVGSGCRAHEGPNKGPGGSPASDLKYGEPNDDGVGNQAFVTGDLLAENDRSKNLGTKRASSTSASQGVARPDESNTGPTTPGSLTPAATNLLDVDDAVVEGVSFIGAVTVTGTNVTLRNFSIDGNGDGYGIVVNGAGLLLEDGEISNTTSAGIAGWATLTARRLHIYEHGADAMKIEGDNSLLEYNFIEKLGTNVSAHADANQSYAGNNIRFRYNNLWMPHPGTPNFPGGDYKSNSNFIIKGESGTFYIENNWLNGGAYTIYCTTPNTHVTENIFHRDFNYGQGSGSGKCATWSGNVWFDTGLPVEDQSQ